ncbi:DarT ssDNA thymidine ADP-ribosyltransferase family protein [Stenotrophomonas maltophilia]|uniref:DarT ssDNA thymidine ADP-ribosyltransferase family protein n=1 Tax=Stenotrophomonas maltophilia TaxID=40324 RepID=UPI001C65C618|nr:DarT ssDNA thymidine ADP-ribosyltransferase family protein [Stenotrophomonas maltophilia]
MTEKEIIMAATIQEFVHERGIKYLVHFTRESNLTSIIQRGLVPRDLLAGEGGVKFNDTVRLDGTSAVCLSIDFPNYKMFFKVKQADVDESWAIVAVSPAVLSSPTVAFCAGNAASAAMTSIPIAQRMGLQALQGMYADWNGVSRATLGIPDRYPTNPQAEVLMLEGVSREHILGVFALNQAVKARLVATHAKLNERNVAVNASIFRYRQDYAHWKQVADSGI